MIPHRGSRYLREILGHSLVLHLFGFLHLDRRFLQLDIIAFGHIQTAIQRQHLCRQSQRQG